MPKKSQPNTYEITIEGRPRTKGRPRMTRTGHTYTPPETKKAEQLIVEAVGDDFPVFEGPVKLVASFSATETHIKITSLPDWEKPKLTGDVDNYIKLVSDALEKAGVIPNDRDVVWLEGEKK